MVLVWLRPNQNHALIGRMRYLTPYLQRDLKKKLVFLAGPRQVGKSTLAKSLVSSSSHYLNWDIQQDRKTIRSVEWPKDGTLVVLDELHKLTRWTGFLKGVIDEYGTTVPLLVTGSARLETFRKGGDALTGRTYMYRFHPIDPIEGVTNFGFQNLAEVVERLMQTGGFPEAFIEPQEANRLREDRLQVVVREDVRDLSTISDLRGMQLLVELLRERVGGTVSYANLAGDIGVSPPTVKKWIDLLERLYVIFLIHPFSHNLARSIRREPKVFFYDCAAGTNGNGACFESLIAGFLLKQIHLANDSRGTRFNLWYFRDKDQREVDFLVTNGLKPVLLVEAKLNDDAPHNGLAYLKSKFPNAKAYHLVNRSDFKQKERAGVNVMSTAGLKDLADNFA